MVREGVLCRQRETPVDSAMGCGQWSEGLLVAGEPPKLGLDDGIKAKLKDGTRAIPGRKMIIGYCVACGVQKAPELAPSSSLDVIHVPYK